MWDEANLTERRKLLLTMLDAVYVDTVEEKAIVAIRPKPAFKPVFEIATTRKGSDVILINEPPLASNEPEAADSCFWWRRGGRDEPHQPVKLAAALHGWKALPVMCGSRLSRRSYLTVGLTNSPQLPLHNHPDVCTASA